MIHGGLETLNNFVQEVAIEAIKINKLIDTTLIVIIIELIRGYPKIRAPFHEDLAPHLIL